MFMTPLSIWHRKCAVHSRVVNRGHFFFLNKEEYECFPWVRHKTHGSSSGSARRVKMDKICSIVLRKK